MNRNYKIAAISGSVVLGFLISLLSPGIQAKTLEKSRSIYRNIVIDQNKSTRCMRFETRRKEVSNQACMNTNNPQKLVLEYTQYILTGLAYHPEPKQILIIGLGGGLLPRAFSTLMPDAIAYLSNAMLSGVFFTSA